MSGGAPGQLGHAQGGSHGGGDGVRDDWHGSRLWCHVAIHAARGPGAPGAGNRVYGGGAEESGRRRVGVSSGERDQGWLGGDYQGPRDLEEREGQRGEVGGKDSPGVGQRKRDSVTEDGILHVGQCSRLSLINAAISCGARDYTSKTSHLFYFPMSCFHHHHGLKILKNFSDMEEPLLSISLYKILLGLGSTLNSRPCCSLSDDHVAEVPRDNV